LLDSRPVIVRLLIAKSFSSNFRAHPPKGMSKMKTATLILSALVLSTIAACGHFPIMDHPLTTSVAQNEKFPPELDAYLEAATTAAKQIILVENVAEWQIEYDKVKEIYAKIPEDAVNQAVQNECNSISEQMEIGKLAVELKKIDIRAGTKQCRDVSADILKHVKKIKALNSKAKK
jgi:hypothetical protein